MSIEDYTLRDIIELNPCEIGVENLLKRKCEVINDNFADLTEDELNLKLTVSNFKHCNTENILWVLARIDAFDNLNVIVSLAKYAAKYAATCTTVHAAGARAAARAAAANAHAAVLAVAAAADAADFADAAAAHAAVVAAAKATRAAVVAEDHAVDAAAADDAKNRIHTKLISLIEENLENK